MYKIFVTCPEAYTERIINSMSKAGAGNIGNYSHCAFITKGFGNYKPNEEAKPFIGEVGKMNREPEDKIEMVCQTSDLDKVIKAIKEVHPYETPEIDVITIDLFS